ncbi:MAG: (2Fe-2S)-binding protein, partial [Alphaproteobacteria bacterium]|nr:(2Fe-2S)-binding protein [Alphaproteobacteria bacterium]
MFKRLPEADEATIEFHFDGQAYRAVAGDSLAAALLANGIGQFGRNAADNSPRGPHCMIGNCFDCLVLLADGRTAQACL